MSGSVNPSNPLSYVPVSNGSANPLMPGGVDASIPLMAGNNNKSQPSSGGASTDSIVDTIKRLFQYLFGGGVKSQQGGGKDGAPGGNGSPGSGGYVVNMPLPMMGRTPQENEQYWLNVMQQAHDHFVKTGGWRLYQMQYMTPEMEAKEQKAGKQLFPRGGPYPGEVGYTGSTPPTPSQQSTVDMYHKMWWDDGANRPWSQTGGTPFGDRVRSIFPNLPASSFPQAPQQ